MLGTAAAKLAGVPYVVRTVHGLPEPMTGWDRVKSGAHDALDRATLRVFADRIIAVSSNVAEVLKRSGYKRSIVTHVHNGIDLSNVNASRSPQTVRGTLGLADGAVVIGTTGRLSPVKGHEYLVRAARFIVEREPRARFVFVGTGPLKRELQALAVDLGVGGACRFVDPGTLDASVYDLMAAMDVFVLPSLSEGIPMALLEAMALERPVIATRVGGVPEMIVDRSNGLLVRPQDDRALASACLTLADDRQLAGTLARRGRQVVEQRFSAATNCERVLGVYQAVAQERRTAVGPLAICTAPVLFAAGVVRRRRRRELERRRLEASRRDPSAIVTALGNAKNVLVVCHGNIIRSPFAARLIAQALGNRVPVAVQSAGLQAVPGRPSHPYAIRTAEPLRVDLTTHAASRITPESVACADVIFVMDIDQLAELQSRFPAARSKTFLLTCLDPEVPLEIADPVNGDEPAFTNCYRHIVQAVQPIVHTLGRAAS